MAYEPDNRAIPSEAQRKQDEQRAQELRFRTYDGELAGMPGEPYTWENRMRYRASREFCRALPELCRPASSDRAPYFDVPNPFLPRPPVQTFPEEPRSDRRRAPNTEGGRWIGAFDDLIPDPGAEGDGST